MRENFHRAVVSRRRSYRKAKCKGSKSWERSSSASKGVPKSESGAHTFSESADEWAPAISSSTPLAVMCLSLSEHTSLDGGTKGDGLDTWSWATSSSRVRYDAHRSGPERERASGRLSSSCCSCADKNGVASFLMSKWTLTLPWIIPAAPSCIGRQPLP